MNPRTRTLLDLEATVASLAASVTELEADKTALKEQLEKAWAAADTARAQRDQARAIAVELEQQLAHVGGELHRLAEAYRSKGYTAAEGIDDCIESYQIATDQVMADAVEDLADGAA